MKKFIPVLLTLVILTSCTSSSENEESESVEDTPVPSQYISSDQGIVSSAHPLATQAGVDILNQGGNAVDAAVATAFTLSVVEPSMSGLGGRLQAIVMSAEGEVNGVDATTQAGIDYDPATAPQARYGYPVIGVPGVVKGLTKLLEEHGTMDLPTVMAPAIAYAENGYEILFGEALRHSMVIDMVREFPGTSASYINGDSTYKEGELLIQKDLAQTLKTIARDGQSAFYTGEIAEKITEDVQGNGGTLSMAALEAYEAKDAGIVSGSYRGYDLNGLNLPSFGAITIEILHILENYDMENASEDEWARLIFEANTAAYRDRARQIDPGTDLLTDKEYAKELSEQINASRDAAYVHGPESWSAEGHTTHLSVVDKDGNAIALTQSLGPNMGSRVITPGLGFVYATTLGGYLGEFQPEQRAASHISPFILSKDGKPVMVLGAAGGSRIITAIVQTISRVVDRGMSLEDALEAGRVHSGDSLILLETHEGTWNENPATSLRNMGYTVEEIDQRGRFGRVHAIMRDGDVWKGAADPDWEGTAGTPKEK